MARKLKRERPLRPQREYVEKSWPMPDEGLQGWIISYCRKNFWKVAGRMEFNDLVQEANMLYCKCRSYYGTKLDPPHFMSLFKMAFSRKMIDLAKERTKFKFIIHEYEQSPDEAFEAINAYENLRTVVADDNSTIAQLIADAPAIVKDVLRLFVDEDSELHQPTKRFSDGTRETTNQFFVRLLGLDTDPDLLAETKRYLSAAV